MTRRFARLWPYAMTLLIMAPLLRPGYVLAYDMVFVPDQPLRSDFFGLGSSVPRAVPSDALVSLASGLVPGQVVQKLVLVACLSGAGAGMVRLTQQAPVAVTVAATSWYVWNPYVAERLLIGQWVVLIAYATLPWVAAAALAVRRGRSSRAIAGLVIVLAVAATSASGSLMAVGVAAPIVCWRGTRASRLQQALLACAAVMVSAPWIVAGLMHRGELGSSAAAVEAFSASGEGHLGVLPSVVGLGGIWNAETVPASRLGWVAVGWTVALCLIMVAGVAPLSRFVGPQVARAMLAVGAVSLLTGLAGAISPGLVVALANGVPGAALLRDGHRYLGGFALIEALLFGFGVCWVAARIGDQAVRRAATALLAVAPLLVMPDLAWGAGARLAPVSYPAAWGEARDAMLADGRAGEVLVWPLAPYRAYAWNAGRPVLDPASRYFPRNSVASDRLTVDGRAIQPEDSSAAAAAEFLGVGEPEQLAALGVGYIVADAELASLRAHLGGDADLIYSSAEIEVYALDDAAPERVSRGRLVVTWLAWLSALAATAGAVLQLHLVGRLRHKGRKRNNSLLTWPKF